MPKILNDEGQRIDKHSCCVLESHAVLAQV